MMKERGANDPIGLPPFDAPDPVLDAYRKDIDRTLLRENLKRTPQERLEALARFVAAVAELRAAEERRGREGD